MPVRILTDSERERYECFPRSIPPQDLFSFFTLTDADRALVLRRTGDHHQLALALQLCALRYLGFIPADVTTSPAEAVAFVASQLGLASDSLAAYGGRPATRRAQVREVQAHLDFRRVSAADIEALSDWLLERALEHDKPSLLFDLASERLRNAKVVPPGVTPLERIVAEIRARAQQVTYNALAPLLSPERRSALDRLLVTDAQTGRTPLAWFKQPAITNSPRAILEAIDKFKSLRDLGVTEWDLSVLNPNRLKFLARLGKKSTNQMLERSPPRRRYPILIAFLRQTLVDVIDEAITMFDRCLADAYARSGRDLDEFRKTVARTVNEKVILFGKLGRIVLDPGIADQELRAAIYARVPKEKLRTAVEECAKIARPVDDHHFDILANRYGFIRQFSPTFLDAFQFRSNMADEPLLQAIDVVRQMNREGLRRVPEGAPLGHVNAKWEPYVHDGEERIDRRYYELCTLWELRNALRAGDVWLQESRRYANPETYLIPRGRWETCRSDICELLKAPEEGATRLAERQAELEELLSRMDQTFPSIDHVRLEGGKLVVSPFKAEERSKNVEVLEQQVTELLPRVDLSDLLIEVDSWTRFTDHFEHAGGGEPRAKDLLTHLYAAVLAQATNLGSSQMAAIADLSYSRLAWCSNWYLRDDTLRRANTAIVNFQHRQPLSQHWGGGTLSSSDGQRFPVSVKARNATANPRYFGYGRGLTGSTWTSDQFSQYGTKIVPTSLRDATYVLDEILGNETELSIVEHTTDTAGYTEIVFALFDLLGRRFSPRLRDLGDQRLYRVDRTKRYENLEPLLKGTINRERILKRWDDVLRVAGSLKTGWVTASLFISKLQAPLRKSALARAIQEYGRLVKTIFVFRYLESEDYRRRIHTQLNKGEALHSLRRFLFFANQGLIRLADEESQANQAMCLTMVTNAVITWNTVYMAAAIERLKERGSPVDEAAIAHLWPSRHEHVNPYGKYQFNVGEGLGRRGLRPLREQ